MKHDIILNIPKDDPNYPIYSVFSGEELPISGQTFLVISSDEPIVHANFLQARLSAPSKYEGLIVWILSRYVVCVCADERDRKIGFGSK